jgi:hypothetical protein
MLLTFFSRYEVTFITACKLIRCNIYYVSGILNNITLLYHVKLPHVTYEHDVAL